MFTTPFAFMAAPAGGGYDPDAQAYLDAVVAAGGTVNSTIEEATNTLFTDLKTAGIYTKTIAMYPYVGAVQNSCLIEAKLQTAFNMVFNGGWTFSSLGVTPNGTSGWATNNMFADVSLSLNNNSLWTYIGTDPSQDAYTADIGTNDYTVTNHLFSIIGGANAVGDTSSYFDNASSTDRLTFNSATIPSALGFFGNNRTSSTNLNIWYNGTKVGTRTNANTSSLPNDKLQFPVDGSTALQYSKRRHQFDWVGQGLNDTEAASFSTIVNAFQTALGRNVY
jgi:hypothetical protein